MKKLFAFILVLMLAVLSIPTVPAATYEPPVLLRVGLERSYKEMDSIPITNTFLKVGYQLDGLFINGGTISAPNLSMRVLNGTCFNNAGLYASYDLTKQAAASYLNYAGTFVPSLTESGFWTVYGVSFPSESAAMNVASSASGTLLPASSRRVALYSGNQVLAVFDNAISAVQLSDANGGLMNLNGNSYRGAIAFGRYNGKNLTAVNVLNIEEYLYSVVPSEMSSGWHLEALKAQAVAARTYTTQRKGIHAEQGYELCDLGHCQSYLGAGNEAATTTQAVNETWGQAIYYDGQPINAVYFSSSGGVTEDSVHVWVTALPYLKSVAEINEYEPKIWTRTFTMAEITALLTKNNINIGTATGISIVSTQASGRVSELIIKGTEGSKTLVKEEIRNFFASSAGGVLESRNFTLSNGSVSYIPAQITVTDGKQTALRELTTLYALSANGGVTAVNTATAYDGLSLTTYNAKVPLVTTGGNTVVFSGKGWGHGVGMSQRGAEGMAQLGYDYKTILAHYYTGVVIN